MRWITTQNILIKTFPFFSLLQNKKLTIHRKRDFLFKFTCTIRIHVLGARRLFPDWFTPTGPHTSELTLWCHCSIELHRAWPYGSYEKKHFISQCSVTCGAGTKARSVECSDRDIKCDPGTKPETISNCDLKECPQWITSPWEEVLSLSHNTFWLERKFNEF